MAADDDRASVTWIDDAEFTVGDVAFRAAPFERFKSTPQRFCVVKRPDLVQRYESLVAELAPKTIFELGIFAGGSTALLSQLAQPDKLVAIDVSDTREVALDGYIENHGLSDSVKAYFGVDQSDTARLKAIIAEDFSRRPLDLVVDDASHHLDLTRASFNTLFPRLRTGGIFVIEDWSWAHTSYRVLEPGETPLTRLVFEIIMACPSWPGLIADVVVDQDWVLVRRGPLRVGRNTFDITACFGDQSRALLR